jgi:hypothetical protein
MYPTDEVHEGPVSVGIEIVVSILEIVPSV